MNHTWIHKKNTYIQEIYVQGGLFLLTRDLASFLLEHPTFQKMSSEKVTSRTKQYFPGMVSKVIKGQRKSVLGWEIKDKYIMVIRSQAQGTPCEGSETTGEVESS